MSENKYQKQNIMDTTMLSGESGRSMVEMLGVLAVMGVLSVGGVAMYTTAMNKYRANELLNEASKRAVMVAGQLLSNPDVNQISLAQFGNSPVAGVTFDDTATIDNGRIVLSLVGVVEDPICAQMKAAAGGNSAMTINESCSKLAFNADMSAVDFVFDGDDLPCVGDNCPGSSSSSSSSDNYYRCSHSYYEAIYDKDGNTVAYCTCSDGATASRPSDLCSFSYSYYYCSHYSDYVTGNIFGAGVNIISCYCSEGASASDWGELCLPGTFYCSRRCSSCAGEIWDQNGNMITHCACTHGAAATDSSKLCAPYHSYYSCSYPDGVGTGWIVDGFGSVVRTCFCMPGSTASTADDLCISSGFYSCYHGEVVAPNWSRVNSCSCIEGATASDALALCLGSYVCYSDAVFDVHDPFSSSIITSCPCPNGSTASYWEDLCQSSSSSSVDYYRCVSGDFVEGPDGSTTRCDCSTGATAYSWEELCQSSSSSSSVDYYRCVDGYYVEGPYGYSGYCPCSTGYTAYSLADVCWDYSSSSSASYYRCVSGYFVEGPDGSTTICNCSTGATATYWGDLCQTGSYGSYYYCSNPADDIIGTIYYGGNMVGHCVCSNGVSASNEADICLDKYYYCSYGNVYNIYDSHITSCSCSNGDAGPYWESLCPDYSSPDYPSPDYSS